MQFLSHSKQCLDYEDQVMPFGKIILVSCKSYAKRISISSAANAEFLMLKHGLSMVTRAM